MFKRTQKLIFRFQFIEQFQFIEHGRIFKNLISVTHSFSLDIAIGKKIDWKWRWKKWHPGRFEPATNNQLLNTKILHFKIFSLTYIRATDPCQRPSCLSYFHQPFFEFPQMVMSLNPGSFVVWKIHGLVKRWSKDHLV